MKPLEKCNPYDVTETAIPQGKNLIATCTGRCYLLLCVGMKIGNLH
jgi:hypothetical protein